MPQDLKKRCGAVIVDRSRRYMIILRERSFPIELRRWGIPKGKFKVGEDADTCIHREVLEEVGIDLNKTTHSSLSGVNFQLIMLDKHARDIPLIIDRYGEIEEAMWIKISDVLDWMHHKPGDFNMYTKQNGRSLLKLLP